MSFYGADTAQLRDLADKMSEDSMRLADRQQELGAKVARLHSIWQGPDADAFQDKWKNLSGTFEDAKRKTTQAGVDLRQQARDQDNASDPRSMLERWNDLMAWPAKITEGIRNIQHIIQDPKEIKKLFGKFKDLKSDFSAARRNKGLWKLYKKTIMEYSGEGWSKLFDGIKSLVTEKMTLPGSEWFGEIGGKLDAKALEHGGSKLLKIGTHTFGKFMPGLDIGLGVHQMMTADNGFEKFSGGMSTVGGALTLIAPFTGPAAPIVAGVGVGLGVVSAGLDLGKMAYDNIPVVKDVVDKGAKVVKDGWNGAKDFVGSIGKGIGSIFG